MTEGSKMVFEYLKANAAGSDLTAGMVAEACGVSIRVVTGSVNGLVKKNLAYREEVEVENGKGKTEVVKFIRLNEEAFDYDPDATPAKA